MKFDVEIKGHKEKEEQLEQTINSLKQEVEKLQNEKDDAENKNQDV